MILNSSSFTFYWRWLLVAASVVSASGLLMVIAPVTTMQAFSQMVYGEPDHIASFGVAASNYIALAHAVLGASMVGWGMALLFLLIGPFRQGNLLAWQGIAVSQLAWFIPDTAFSLWSGFWQNAVLNLAFAVAFAIPLWRTRPAFQRQPAVNS